MIKMTSSLESILRKSMFFAAAGIIALGSGCGNNDNDSFMPSFVGEDSKAVQPVKRCKAISEEEMTNKQMQEYLGIKADGAVGPETLNASWVFLNFYKEEFKETLDVSRDKKEKKTLVKDTKRAIADLESRCYYYGKPTAYSVKVRGRKIHVYVPKRVIVGRAYTFSAGTYFDYKPSAETLKRVNDDYLIKTAKRIMLYAVEVQHHYIMRSISTQLDVISRNDYDYVRNVMTFVSRTIKPSYRYSKKMLSPMQILKVREGDCTEDTVLRTSLIGAKGMKYGVVQGLPPVDAYKQFWGTPSTHIATAVDLPKKYKGVRFEDKFLLVDNGVSRPGLKGGFAYFSKSTELRLITE